MEVILEQSVIWWQEKASPNFICALPSQEEENWNLKDL